MAMRIPWAMATPKYEAFRVDVPTSTLTYLDLGMAENIHLL